MNSQSKNDLALARQKGLVLRDLGDELLIYDRESDQAHCLNRSAAAVWHHCDGGTTPAQIAILLQKELGAPVDEDFVFLALNQFSRDRLLESSVVSGRLSQLSRREVVRRLGLGVAIALPLVASITAPSPAQAATCRSPGSVCSTSSQCCSNICACPSAPCPPTVMRCV